MVVLLALYERGKVRGGVERRAVGLQNDARRDLLLVLRQLHGHNQRALALDGEAFVAEALHHVGDIRLCVAFTLPEVKFDVEVCIVFLEVSHRHVHDMPPDGRIAAVALLQLDGRLMRARGERRILLAAGGCGRIDGLQLGDGKGRFGRVFAGKIGVKIGKIGALIAELLNDEAHLQAPVAQMHVADDIIAEIALDALDGLADDGRADVTDVQRLCNVCAAVIDNDALGRVFLLQAEFLADSHLVQIRSDRLRRHAEVDEAGLHRLDERECAAAFKLRGHFFGDDQRRFVILLGGRQRAVALIFAQIRPA